MKLIHVKEIKVTQEHLDKNNHVNNVQYVHWVEEVASEHWDLLKDKTEYKNDFWVLYDHHIQYKKQIFLNDIITVKTYPEQPEGMKQPRKVEFYCNNQLMVESRTLWVMFDHNTHKIKRLTSNWINDLSEKL